MSGPSRKRRKPRKRRTRGHVIAAQSVNFVDRFIIDEGHTAERVEHDYGYDLIVMTYSEEGFVEEGQIYVQLKASDSLADSAVVESYAYQLDIRDYNLWHREPMPVFFVLYDSCRRRAFWLYFQHYFESDRRRKPRPKVKSVSLHIPSKNKITRRTIRDMRRCKEIVLGQLDKRIRHHD